MSQTPRWSPASNDSTSLPEDSAVLKVQSRGLGNVPSQPWLWVSLNAWCQSCSSLPSYSYSLPLLLANPSKQLSLIFSISPKCHLHNAVEYSTLKKKMGEVMGEITSIAWPDKNLELTARQSLWLFRVPLWSPLPCPSSCQEFDVSVSNSRDSWTPIAQFLLIL